MVKSMNVQQFANMVVLEMTEMKKLGLVVPDRAFELAKDLDEMEGYTNMRVSECADLIISLSQINAI